MSIDGNEIVYCGTNNEIIFTSEPLPAVWRSFIFKTKIRKCSEDVEMFIGFKINGQYIRWINTAGNLDMHGARFTDLEPYGEHDEICWHLQKICVQEKYYQYFKCIKNGKTIYPLNDEILP